MSVLEYRKTFKIEYKVIKEDDVLQIARLFQEQFEENDYRRRFTLHFNDDSVIVGEDISIFEADEFKRRLCETIRFEYASNGFEKKIEIYLRNTAIYNSDSEVEVTSNDKEWYDSIINRITTLFDEVKNQVKLEKYKYILVLFLSCIEGILLGRALAKLFPSVVNSTMMQLLSSGGTALFTFINFVLVDKLCKAFPKIEFAFGPDHLNPSKKIRKTAYVIIPFIIDIGLFIIGLIVG